MQVVHFFLSGGNQKEWELRLSKRKKTLILQHTEIYLCRLSGFKWLENIKCSPPIGMLRLVYYTHLGKLRRNKSSATLNTAVPTTSYDILTITTQFESESITFSTELVGFCLHLQQLPAWEYALCKNSSCSHGGESCARKSQNSAGSNVSDSVCWVFSSEKPT